MHKSLVLIHAANPVMVLWSEEAGWVDVVVWDGMGVDKLVVVLVAVLIKSKIWSWSACRDGSVVVHMLNSCMAREAW